MIKVGIIGGTGYTGVELLRLLIQHPQVEIAVVTSRSEAGKSVAELFPNLRGHLDLIFTKPAIKTLKLWRRGIDNCRLFVKRSHLTNRQR